MIDLAYPHDRGDVVIVVVGVVKEPSMLDEKTAGVHRGRRPGVPPYSWRPCRGGEDPGGALNHLTLLVFGHSDVPLPAPAVTRYLETEGGGLLSDPRTQLNGSTTSVQGRGHASTAQRISHARPSGPSPIFKVTFHAQVPFARHYFNGLVDELVSLVSHPQAEFRTLLDIDDERYGESRPVRPAHVGRRRPVSSEVAHGGPQGTTVYHAAHLASRRAASAAEVEIRPALPKSEMA